MSTATDAAKSGHRASSETSPGDLHQRDRGADERDRTDEVDTFVAVDDVEELPLPIADAAEVDHPVERGVREP
jgi:hypothetical protein